MTKILSRAAGGRWWYVGDSIGGQRFNVLDTGRRAVQFLARLYWLLETKRNSKSRVSWGRSVPLYEHNLRDDYNPPASIRERIPKHQGSLRRKVRI